jgi:hypothetical protein
MVGKTKNWKSIGQVCHCRVPVWHAYEALLIVWCWHPELVWKGCRQSEADARLKESDCFHLQLCPHMVRQLQIRRQIILRQLSGITTCLLFGCQSKSAL